MGNCGSAPKTNEGPEPVPEPVTEVVKVELESTAVDANVETKTAEKETPNEDNKSLSTLLNTVRSFSFKNHTQYSNLLVLLYFVDFKIIFVYKY